jgi:hypothetical protein
VGIWTGQSAQLKAVHSRKWVDKREWQTTIEILNYGMSTGDVQLLGRLVERHWLEYAQSRPID